MKLGEFRKLTENLSDDTDIVICYRINEGTVANYPMKNVSVVNRDTYRLKSDFSEQVIYVDEDEELMGLFSAEMF